LNLRSGNESAQGEDARHSLVGVGYVEFPLDEI